MYSVLTTPTRKRVLKRLVGVTGNKRGHGLNDTDPQEGTETIRFTYRQIAVCSLNDTDPQEGTETQTRGRRRPRACRVLTTPTRKRVLKLFIVPNMAAISRGLNDTDPQEGTETGRARGP